jgi:hypothetical protein
MHTRIQEFIEYATDTEATSEVSFIQHIHNNNDIFQLEHRHDFERIVQVKLQQWIKIKYVEQDTQIPAITITDIDSKKKEQEDDISSSSKKEEKKTLQERHVSIALI